MTLRSGRNSVFSCEGLNTSAQINRGEIKHQSPKLASVAGKLKCRSASDPTGFSAFCLSYYMTTLESSTAWSKQREHTQTCSKRHHATLIWCVLLLDLAQYYKTKSLQQGIKLKTPSIHSFNSRRGRFSCTLKIPFVLSYSAAPLWSFFRSLNRSMILFNGIFYL